MNYESTLNNTDKFSGGYYNNNLKGHNYQNLYKKIINNNLNKILEIGTAHGGFIKFIKDNEIKSYVVGVDMDPNGAHPHVTCHDKYNNLYDNFYIGDAYNTLFIDWILENNLKFDLVIEDGSHHPPHQQFIISNIDKFLNDTGIFICEDIQSYDVAKNLIKFIPNSLKKYSYIWDGSDSIGRKDDICIIIDLSF
jgi:SAM-dependent methyltransferase